MNVIDAVAKWLRLTSQGVKCELWNRNYDFPYSLTRYGCFNVLPEDFASNDWEVRIDSSKREDKQGTDEVGE